MLQGVGTGEVDVGVLDKIMVAEQAQAQISQLLLQKQLQQARPAMTLVMPY